MLSSTALAAMPGTWAAHKVTSETQTRSGSPRSQIPRTRSLRVSTEESGIVVRRKARGWQPRIPLRRMIFATV